MIESSRPSIKSGANQVNYKINNESGETERILNTGFREKEYEYRTFIKTHYLRNTLFFYVSCLCAILVGSYTYSIVLIVLVLVEKFIEIYAVYYNIKWMSYLSHAIGCAMNYANIICSIAYSS